jgi:NADPH:quinone reductase-like Zn-dependent oxidoreductase
MRAITQSAFGDPEVLHLVEVPTPSAGPGQVVVATRAAGVNPVDAVVRAGAAPLLGDPPFTVGWDVAGVVSEVGPDVTQFQVGDRMYGMPRFPAEAGAYAEAVVVDVSELAHIPDGVDDAHAAALPLVALTAHQALVEAAGLQGGERVLIHAAGGGLGHVAVQLARELGAQVIATSSPGKADFVRSLGAAHIIDYTTEDFTDIEPVDVALDPLGGDTTIRSLRTVRAGGVLALFVGEFDDQVRAEADRRGVRLARISVVPNAEALAAITDLLANGRLVPHVSATFPLEQAADAHRHLDTGVRGKIVLLTAG